MQPFTTKLLSQSSARTQSALGGLPVGGIRDQLEVAGKIVTEFFTRTYRLPGLADNVLNRAERGELQVQIAPDDQLKQQVTHIETSVSQIYTAVIFASLVLTSTLLYINQEHGLGIVGYVCSGVVLVITMLRGHD
jgi:hypothetical protein